MGDTPRIDILDTKFKADPYPTYARLRAEAPVCLARVGRYPVRVWLVTRYDDVVAALKDERFCKDPRNARTGKLRPTEAWILGMYQILTWLFGSFMQNMLLKDEPSHARLRALVHKAFTPRFVEELRSWIETFTEQLLDRVAGQAQMDLIRDYALPLPSTVIAHMLGVPESDRGRFLRWSVAAIDSRSGLGGIIAIPRLFAFTRYIRKLISERRKRPDNDLISALVAAEEQGDRLDETELVSMIFLLRVAGYETTVNLIGNGTLALIENPEEMEKLRDQPSLMPSAVEELLRYDSPLDPATERFARCDIEWAGVTIPKGAFVFAAIASANRDPQQFDQPDVLNLAREPNRHLAFGQGIHYCLGAPLARLEGQIAFTTLLRRFRDLCLAVPRSALRWRKSLGLRGLESLPTAFGAETKPRAIGSSLLRASRTAPTS